MKKLIKVLILVAFVITATGVPSMSHATPHGSTKISQTEASKGQDCHKHIEEHAASNKITQHNKDTSGKCCEKGMCKCITGSCHSSLASILNGSEVALPIPTANKNQFGFTAEFIGSALAESPKRPPKA